MRLEQLARRAKALVKQSLAFLKEVPRGNIHTIGSSKALADGFFRGNDGRFVVFLVAGFDAVNGGWMSTFSIAKESKAFSPIHGARVAVCTAIGELPIRRYTKFDNTEAVFPFRRFLCGVPENSEVLVHVPEVYLEKFVLRHARQFRNANIKWRFNILLQNIDLAPDRSLVAQLQTLGSVTATTAHEAYAGKSTQDLLGCPVQLLSIWTCPEEYNRTAFHNKDKLIVVSPDKHPLKAAILRELRAALADHEIIEIKRMTYREYRAVIQRAKYSFTFGEGLDGYFVEPIFCGAIGMAIHNDRFFPAAYQGLEGIFEETQIARGCISQFIERTKDDKTAKEISSAQFAMQAKQYQRSEYLDNLRRFYTDNFSAL